MRARRSGARSPFRQLRDLCEFWADERKHVTCCQFADDEALTNEAELFDCETCAISRHLDVLDVDNRRAWDLAQVLFVRLIADTHALGPVLLRLTPDLDPEDFEQLMRRLTLMYDVLVPPQRPS